MGTRLESLARHLLIGVVIALLVLPAVSVAQTQPEQVVRGRVLLPAKDRKWEGCINLRHDEVDRYKFKVDPRTHRHPFVLEPTSGVAVDVDILFYGSGINGYSARGPGEHGIVPPESTSAVVCLNQGLNAEFLYRAGPAVDPPSLDEEARQALHSADLRLLARSVTPDPPRKLAFQGDLMIAGGNAGINIYRLLPRPPYMKHLTFYECYGGKGDVSIWGDYAFQSISDQYPYVILDSGKKINGQEGEACNNTNDSVGKSGIRVVDISDPTHPKQAGFMETPCGSQTHTLVPEGGKSYIYVPIPCDDSMPDDAPVKPFTNQIHVLRFDPRHPDRPEHVGSPTLSGQFGCYDITIFAPRDLAACPQWFNPALRSSLLDISDRTNPRVLGNLPFPEDVQWATHAAFTWDGHYLLVGDTNSAAIDEHHYLAPYCTGDDSVQAGRIWIFDIADAYNPKRVGSFFLPRRGASPDLQCAPHELNVIPMKDPDRYVAVVGWHAGGLTIVDFSDPTEPRELAHWQPARATSVRGSYWYNSRIYSVEYWSGAGVRVFELAGATARDAFRYSKRLNPQTQLAEFR